MNREELSALHDVHRSVAELLGLMLRLPDRMRAELVRWFTPEAGIPTADLRCESAQCALENRSPFRPPIFVGSGLWFKTATRRRSTSGGLKSYC
jgi:hypothetical protein